MCPGFYMLEIDSPGGVWFLRRGCGFGCRILHVHCEQSAVHVCCLTIHAFEPVLCKDENVKSCSTETRHCSRILLVPVFSYNDIPALINALSMNLL